MLSDIFCNKQRHYFYASLKAYQTANRSFWMDGLFLPPKFIPPHRGQNKPLFFAPHLSSCHSNPLANNSPCICTLKPREADENVFSPLPRHPHQHPPTSSRHLYLSLSAVSHSEIRLGYLLDGF